MILFGCLLAFGAAVAPRLILILAWIFSDRWSLVWKDDILLPVLGIIFLPYTTIMFMLAVTITPTGNVIEGWDWLWIGLGLMLDFMKWGQMLANRKEAQKQAVAVYSSGAPVTPTDTGSSSQASTSAPAAPAASTDAASPNPAPEPDATSADSGSGKGT